MTTKVPPQIKCILFDLGGVIINIDWKRSVYAFADITGLSFEELNVMMRGEELVQRIETGELSPEQFREWFRSKFEKAFSAEEIDKAWNAMLMDIPKSRVQIVENLSKDYQVMCLSNTNAIHIKALNTILENSSIYSDLKQLMHKTYYSHELLCRKPDPRAWEIVLEQNNLSPDEVLYFDDNENNHEQALALGLNSVLISNDYSIENYFNE